jgi:hypothetical protein
MEIQSHPVSLIHVPYGADFNLQDSRDPGHRFFGAGRVKKGV